MTDRRERIMATVDDMAACFLFYDRKEDSYLPMGEIEAAVKAGEVTTEEIAERFRKALGE